MMAPQPAQRRRQRSELESDDEADSVRASEQSSPSTSFPKRARTDENHNRLVSEEPLTTPHNGHPSGHDNENEEEGENFSEDGSSPGQFQPGAIIRVKLTNFVTYENAEFFPGPNLNMVIGPNGTGKSSLVCAICLGLGWGPQHLGRAGQVGEFVKHGMSDAYIEIELQRRPAEDTNHVVRLRIIRDGNAREWWLNDKRSSLKSVATLTKGLSIQIDNLCQFLPQDKVSEFAALSPVELLQQTQRAAAPEEMLEMHEDLKKYRKDQKGLESKHAGDQAMLTNLETRQQNVHGEVERLQERHRIQEHIDILQKTVPFVEYSIALAQHKVFKASKVEALTRLRKFEASIAPNMQLLNEKKEYQNLILAVARERKQGLESAEFEASRQEDRIAALDAEMAENEQQTDVDRGEERKKQQEMTVIQTKIRTLQARANGPPVEFNPAEWNERTVRF
jgi:chromosome segregation ATPase